ncbi:MAG: bifunctional oligoribonuclease/PAP phosphatase NrnA [Bacilli bacterium]|nr:bifunctional oligoribonuclease/PAP phosphatase NrnA [Clostridium sp.]MED9979244.1 bifunctional oligoribonuclease/PAP phosphatase NrnA [Bacilli bacterium]
MNIYKQIFKVIKKYDTIVIVRHIGADPDALGSQFALKEIILKTFPNKKVYAVGNPASRFKFFGNNEKIDNIDTTKGLLIVLDTPDIKRIDGVSLNNFEYVIKIDHHPIIDKYANIELIDEDSCSTSQLILEFIFNNKIEINKEIGEKLYLGIVGDTDRFLHDYTSSKTFSLVTRLLEETNIDFTSLYKVLYQRPISEIRFEGYIYQNLILTENGVAYIKITDRKLKEFGVDSAAAGNMINDLKFVNEIIVWVFLTEDIKSNLIRANIRSVGPYINDVATKFGGGGHKYASGVKLKTWDDSDKLINELDELVKNYKN